MIEGIQIIEIQDDDEKFSCTRNILEKLPEWFGNKQARGFESLITLTEMWDEENPCLIMLKPLL